MGIYDRDYMRNRDPEETERQYEEERIAAEYGDAAGRHGISSRKIVCVLGIVLLVVFVVGYLCSF